MNILPSEILHKVFIRVPLKQRLECMLVCRYWYNSISKLSLLYEVEIKGDVKFKKFIDMLQFFPNRGSQVEILKLTISPNHSFDKRELCNILPNLRVFESTFQISHFQPPDFCSQPFESVDPNSKLRVICDNSNCELTRQVLMFGSCLHLRRLELDLDKIKNPRKEIFIHLKSAPTLKELRVGYCNIGIEDLEIIHESLPVLEILYFHTTILTAGELPHGITPAISVRKFSIIIEGMREYPDYPDWYKYIAKKYTNLTGFRCEERETFNANPNQAMRVYRDGILPLYENIGRHLKYFNAINMPTEVNAFNTLDEFGLQIPNFYLVKNSTRPIFEQLAESNQSMYVKSLKLEDTAIASPIILQNFTSLKTLSIDEHKYNSQLNVNLTDYLNALPATLIIFSACFRDAKINELPSHINNVKYFSLRCSVLSPKLAEAISSCFSKLSSLTLAGHVAENIRMDLSNHHFRRLAIHASYDGDRSHGFSVTDSSSTQPQYYIHKSYAIDGVESITAAELRDRVQIDLKYNTVDTLSLYSTRI